MLLLPRPSLNFVLHLYNSCIKWLPWSLSSLPSKIFYFFLSCLNLRYKVYWCPSQPNPRKRFQCSTSPLNNDSLARWFGSCLRHNKEVPSVLETHCWTKTNSSRHACPRNELYRALWPKLRRGRLIYPFLLTLATLHPATVRIHSDLDKTLGANNPQWRSYR